MNQECVVFVVVVVKNEDSGGARLLVDVQTLRDVVCLSGVQTRSALGVKLQLEIYIFFF